MSSSSLAPHIVHGLQAHGGARQKEKRARVLLDAGPSDVHHVPESKLAKLILFLFGWGLISANMAQWLAAAAIEDGLEHADLKKLASIGKGGTYAGNCRRDLLSKFCKRMLLGKPSVIWVPMLNKVSDICLGKQLFLNPIVIISSIWKHFEPMFHRMFGSSSPRSFWEQVDKQDPKLIALRQEMGDSNEWMDWTIPYILWGDGGRFTTKKREHHDLCMY